VAKAKKNIVCAVETKPTLSMKYYPKKTLPLDVDLLEKESRLQDLWIPLEAQPKLNSSNRINLNFIIACRCS
jgi:hypothetical protein